MNWMITGKCNYNCLHCFNASDNSPLMSEFTLEDAEKLLDEAQACGIKSVYTFVGADGTTCETVTLSAGTTLLS